MNRQITNTVMMIRPSAFQYNAETAVNNFYQKDQILSKTSEDVISIATKEFDDLVKVLESAGIRVIIFDDAEMNPSPDAVFSNNWISFHDEGLIYTYPMYAENRRRERRKDIVASFNKDFLVKEVRTLENYEEKDQFLESTGSMVLDRVNKIIYAALSQRTNLDLLHEFANDMSYRLICFEAFQTIENSRNPIYHTNVMMSVGEGFAVVCLDAIDDMSDRNRLSQSLIDTNKAIVEINEHQVIQFAGNMLQLENENNQRYIVMSSSAYASLTQSQIKLLSSFGTLIHSPLNTIERLGGGSARCMITEIFLPSKH